MNMTCGYCKTVATKADMIVSRHTGRAWCRDEDACYKRVSAERRKEHRERARANRGG